jgi:hypothetical protein
VVPAVHVPLPLQVLAAVAVVPEHIAAAHWVPAL